jgi:erythronate-4-phosphate dehydrogenase
MQPETILINSARGAVIEEAALMADISKTQRKVVLDVFEHEPEISQQLFDLVTLVTPHIAGYSLKVKHVVHK